MIMNWKIFKREWTNTTHITHQQHLEISSFDISNKYSECSKYIIGDNDSSQDWDNSSNDDIDLSDNEVDHNSIEEVCEWHMMSNNESPQNHYSQR